MTALWNYAQHFTLADNFYGTNYGPSTPGALNVTAGNTYGVLCGPSFAVINASPCAEGGVAPAGPDTVVGGGKGTDYSDADPCYDRCSYTEDHNTAAQTIAMGGKNIGVLLDERRITWGWFEGGYASPGYRPGDPGSDDLAEVCTEKHKNIGGVEVLDYIPHHEPFQYFAQTANPNHLPPLSVALVGSQDQANHQYDLRDFWGGGGKRQAAGRLLPEAAGLRGRPRRLLRPAR